MIAPGVVELTQCLGAAGKHITIETAGTVFQPVDCDLMSISPKLSNSIPHQREGGRWAAQHDRLRIQHSVLRQLMTAYEYQLKFVIASPGDMDEVRQLAEELKAPSDLVVLMPEGTDARILRERALWLAEVAKEYGYRLTPRLHVELWGDRRGV